MPFECQLCQRLFVLDAVADARTRQNHPRQFSWIQDRMLRSRMCTLVYQLLFISESHLYIPCCCVESPTSVCSDEDDEARDAESAMFVNQSHPSQTKLKCKELLLLLS